MTSKIAYLILAHNTPHHLTRLVRALKSERSVIVIHIDRKAIADFFNDGRDGFEHCRFVKKPTSVYWAEFSIVRATLDLMREALDSGEDLSRLCLLSGSDYPLRPTTYIEEFFDRNRDIEFIDLVKMPCPEFDKRMDRLESYKMQSFGNDPLSRRVVSLVNHFSVQRKLIRRNFKKHLRGLNPYAGSQWWALTSGASRYVVEFVDRNRDIVKFFKNSLAPDESFFQTVIANSPFCGKVQPALTFADWSKAGLSSPATITIDHLREFVRRMTPGDQKKPFKFLFARKFDDNSSALTEFADRAILTLGAIQR